MSSFLNLNKNIYILAFFLIFFLIGIFIFSDYGISIDEDKTRLNGFISLEYIFKIFIPDQVVEINKIIAGRMNTNYGMMVTTDVVTSGIVFDLPLALLELIFQVDDTRESFLLRHLFNFLIFLGGSALGITPGKVGELLKSQFLKEKFGVERTKTVPLIFVENFYDVISAIIISFFGI